MSEQAEPLTAPEPGGSGGASDSSGAAIRSFAAVGDSFTAGTGSQPGACWADRLAATLRQEEPDLVYRNLASEGATSTQALEQLPAALEIEPDLVTLIAGANDVLLSTRPDPEQVAANLAAGFDRVRSTLPGALIVTATFPEQWSFLRLGPRSRARITAGIETVNAKVRELAAERDIPLLDVAVHPGLVDPANFCDDGLHPSQEGHAHAAAAFAELLEAERAGGPR